MLCLQTKIEWIAMPLLFVVYVDHLRRFIRPMNGGCAGGVVDEVARFDRLQR